MKRLLALPLCLLAGCAVGPDYSRPAVAPAAAWRNAPAKPLPAAPWWTAFGDPALAAFEVEAMTANLEIAQALARVEQANAAARGAAAALAPTASLDSSLDRTRQSLNSREGSLASALPGFTRTTSAARVAVSTVWDLDFAGGVRRQREAARAQLAASRTAETAVRLAVSAEVADAYVTIAGGQAQRQAVACHVALLEEQLGLLTLRLQAGEASRHEVDTATAGLRRAAAVLPLLDAALDAQRSRLAVLLGRDPSALPLPDARPDALPLATEPGAGLPADLLRRRPDVLAAEMRLVAANAGIGAALAEYYPQLSLGLFAGQDASPPADLMSPDSGFLQGGVGLRWRLFDFGRIDAQVRVARGLEKEALAAYRATVLKAAADVEAAFAQWRGLRDRLGELEAEHAARLGIQRTATQAFAVGTLSRSERLDAERGLAGSEAELAIARQEVARALINCARALGGPLPVSAEAGKG